MTQRNGLSLREIGADDWPGISGRFYDLNFEQSLTYGCAAAARIGAKAKFIALEDRTGRPVAAACLRVKKVPGLGRGIAWIAAGPLTRHRDIEDPGPDTMQAILSTLRAHVGRAGHILRLRFPVIAVHAPETLADIAAQAGFVPTSRAPRYRTVAVDLSRDEDALMSRLHGKWRNPLRNALKAGLEIDRGPISDLAERFHALYLQVQQAKGFQPDIPPEFYYPLVGPDFDHEVLIARRDGVDMAGLSIGCTGTTAVYLFGATTEAGRRLNAGHFLMWQAMLRGRELGRDWFDLGGIDAKTNPNVARFKLRTGGIELTAAGPFEARPGGPLPVLVGWAETLHKRARAQK